jgi:hypothetical protein
VWLDSLLNNVDRTSRNTNLLSWQKELWLIDHGASLYFHHSWHNWKEQAIRPFSHIKDHVLLPQASELETVDKEMHSLLTEDTIRAIVALVPEEWLLADSPFESTELHREAYVQFLIKRLEHSSLFIKEAQNAQEGLI